MFRIQPEGLADVAAQRLVIPGLGEELVDRAFVDHVGHGREIGITAEDDSNGVRIERLDASQKLRAADLGHPLVRDDHANGHIGEDLEGPTGLELLHGRAKALVPRYVKVTILLFEFEQPRPETQIWLINRAVSFGTS